MTTYDDPLAALLALVRDAAREGARIGVEEALAARASTAPLSPLATKSEIATELGVSTATIDRLSRDGRIPFVVVGDVRRYDRAAVRAVLDQSTAQASQPASQTCDPISVAGVRLLSRGSR